MPDNIGRPTLESGDELSDRDFVIMQTPAVMEKGMPTVKICLEQIRDIDEDSVYLSRSGWTPKFRITHVVREKKPVDYSGCDRMRMVQNDDFRLSAEKKSLKIRG